MRGHGEIGALVDTGDSAVDAGGATFGDDAVGEGGAGLCLGPVSFAVQNYQAIMKLVAWWRESNN